VQIVIRVDVYHAINATAYLLIVNTVYSCGDEPAAWGLIADTHAFQPGSFTGDGDCRRVDAQKCLSGKEFLGLRRLKISELEGTP
jgi:hypothetical protein